ncbi:GTPase [Candidatus Lokiarchaeum ossiferum]|uniref:GTPase n=1 Tax=Candidatus Lokiarchaeum ossiferum TaxID=2951803 RepID=UPI00352F3C18
MPKIKFSYPRGNFPRLCLIGNSNVGKSSLTKNLLSHPQWYKGKIGKTAGSTVRLTIINDPALNYHVIDLPGFGRMTRLDRSSEAFVQEQILKYIEIDRNNIFLMLMVSSADRLGEELDKWYFQNEETVPLTIEFIQFMLNNNIPTVLVLNKIDKLNSYHLKALKEKLLQVFSDFEIEIQGFEATSGFLGILETSASQETGIKELKAVVLQHSQQLQMQEYDDRNTLLDQPPINVKKKKLKLQNDRSKEGSSENSTKTERLPKKEATSRTPRKGSKSKKLSKKSKKKRSGYSKYPKKRKPSVKGKKKKTFRK